MGSGRAHCFSVNFDVVDLLQTVKQLVYSISYADGSQKTDIVSIYTMQLRRGMVVNESACGRKPFVDPEQMRGSSFPGLKNNCTMLHNCAASCPCIGEVH